MSVPLCRCRVLYIGSAIPTITKDGLQGIQQPLKERYPADDSEVKGIDSWLSVWSNGVLIEYVDGSRRTEGAFLPIINLHYCAAVRYIGGGPGATPERDRFLPLDSPFAHDPGHPPIFAAIFRRSSGVKVLECHAFICTNERAANALVRCCFHSYADTICLRMDEKPSQRAIKNGSLGERPETPNSEQQTSEQLTTDDNRDDPIDWDEHAIGQKTWQQRRRQQSGEYEMASTESSIHKKPSSSKRPGKKADAQSEIYEHNGIIVPYGEQIRRSGSQPEIHARSTHLPPHFMPPPPHHFHPMPPPPPGHQFGRRPAFHGPPPGFFMPPPPGHHMGGKHGHPQFHPPHFPHHGPPPPHHHPAFGRGRANSMPPPPFFGPFGFMPPPHFAFMPPPPPHFAHMHAAQRSPQQAPTQPIIETIYDTYPRRGHYEETIYMPTNGTLPPNSVYKPQNSQAEHYEGFYETYGKKRPSKMAADDLNSDSNTSVDDSQFWNDYETGVYRKANLGEKQPYRNGVGKMNGEKSPMPSKSNVYVDGTPKSRTQYGSSTPKTEHRPKTPEIDYDELGNLHIHNKGPSSSAAPAAHPTTTNRQAAVF